MANSLVDTDLPVLPYSAISDIPATSLAPPHTPESLAHINFYMNDVISAFQGDPDLQHRFFYVTVCSLKWRFLLLPGELKYLVILKYFISGKGYWDCFKEVMGCILDTEAGTFILPERKL